MACDAVAVLRSVTLSVVLSVLAAACALIEPPPPPPGAFQAQVRNTLPNPVELSIVRAGERVGAAQPASLPALSETIVTFHIPIAGEWIYAVDGDDQISSDELIPFIGVCPLRVVIDVGDSTFSCLRAP